MNITAGHQLFYMKMASRVTSIGTLMLKVSRLSLQAKPVGSWQCQKCFHTFSSPLLFHATGQLWGEPVKRKKKMDPAIIAAREAKRKKKIEKQMKRLEKFGRRLKPVDEIEGDIKLRKEIQIRKRQNVPLTVEELESRALLQKKWTRFKFRQSIEETTLLSLLLQEQDHALEELKFESPELHQMAIQLDQKLVPFSMKGPTFTPKIKGFVSPDGEYIDTTKTFE